ncbi:MAG: trypsin-like peptidase domain-containing protein [Oligoflexia bacterium]|nr:trypsin-like peptidase domain-containing protein [Oligoflexia bacterium]
MGAIFIRIIILSVLVLSFLGLVIFPHNALVEKKHQNMEFASNVNSTEILKNVDQFLDKHQKGEITYKGYLKELATIKAATTTTTTTTNKSVSRRHSRNVYEVYGSRISNTDSDISTKAFYEYYGSDDEDDYFGSDPKQLPPGMQKIWKSTIMLFGANADGLGIGSGFIVKRLAENKGVIFTAYHVVEDFCDIPRDEEKVEGAGEFNCKMLFALNDIAIDTKTNKVSYDGQNPWKAAVKKVIYFDKLNDFVAIEFNIPADFQVEKLEMLYDIDDINKPKVEKRDIEFVQVGRRNLIAAYELSRDYVRLKYFNLWSIGYPSTYKNDEGEYVHDKQLIRKRWTDGSYEKSVSYETPDELGFVKVFAHTQNMLPGMSGSALCMSDGRILGLNISLILNRSFQRRFAGCTKRMLLEKIKISVPFYNISEYIEKNFEKKINN